jgi:hypothetical protein
MEWVMSQNSKKNWAQRIVRNSQIGVVMEGFPDRGLRVSSKFTIFIYKGSLADPRLRESNEHIFIVRVPRAGGRPGYPSHPSETAQRTSA